ncbi:MAG: hypothetical protein U0Q12_24365 [Vicinamibacterales bacterium]
MEQELREQGPEHAREPVANEEHGRVPQLNRVRDEEPRPRQRHAHEDQHPQLDQTTRTEAVAERSGRHREHEERQPVRDHGEAAERGRLKLLEHDPVEMTCSTLSAIIAAAEHTRSVVKPRCWSAAKARARP